MKGSDGEELTAHRLLWTIIRNIRIGLVGRKVGGDSRSHWDESLKEILVGKIMQNSLTAEDIEELRQIFSLVDVDGSGSISRDEFHNLAKSVGLNLTAEQIDAVIAEVDKNNSGCIDFEEFCATMAKEINPVGLEPERVNELFQRFSRRGTPPGLIRVSDLQNALVTYMHGKVDPLEVHEMLSRYRDSFVHLLLPGSTEKEAFFNYSEYVSMMKKKVYFYFVKTLLMADFASPRSAALKAVLGLIEVFERLLQCLHITQHKRPMLNYRFADRSAREKDQVHHCFRSHLDSFATLRKNGALTASNRLIPNGT